MFPLIETAIAFVVAMLAASLFVSAVVQAVQAAGDYRSDIVRTMLRSVIHGFRSFYNDPNVVLFDYPNGSPDTDKKLASMRAAEEQFVKDVLADPALNARAGSLVYGSTPEQLSALVEYVDAADLVTVARNHAESPPKREHGRSSSQLENAEMASLSPSAQQLTSPLAPAFRRTTIATAEMESVAIASVSSDDAALVADPRDRDEKTSLPASWFLGSATGALPSWATVAKFADYVNRWFPTLEATASQAFKARIRRLTAIVSCLVVVLFNIDALNLARTLYTDSGARSALVKRTEQLQAQAVRLGEVIPDVLPVRNDDTRSVDAVAEAGSLLGTLEEPSLGLGLQDSPIVDKWCAYTGKCSSHSLPLSGWQVAHATLLWLLGLILACVLVSFGAPFWYNALAGILSLKNAVQLRKERARAREST